ncbi:MAG TPA: hypothetical protein PKW63_00770 [Vicinamibacterales bacterium]|nr:hypothetical protein [Acidobacteriota bacterium]HQX80251.1 hypothetical protein [Vicinamibacterales bacterium]
MEALRSFRRNAVHVRKALEFMAQEPGQVGVERGYLQDAGLMERYKRLSIPVRRALNVTDRASFSQALEALAGHDGLGRIRTAWEKLQAELDSTVGLGGGKVPRRQILSDWLDAAAFYDTLERDRAYDRLIDQWGKAAEGIGAQLTEQAAEVIIQLDEAAAAALGEPVILPPPPKTPPPPPDPDEKWWKRLLRI